MGSKRKVIVAVSALAMVILGAVIAVVAVLAAQDVTVQSSINITYQANMDVVGSISAEYKMQDGTEQDLGTFSFDGTGNTDDLDDVGTLAFSRPDNTYAEFTFTFENTSTLDDYIAKLAFTDDAGTGSGSIDNMELTATLGGSADPSFSTTNLSELTSFEVPAENSVVFVLKIAVDDTTANASFIGTLSWDLEIDI